MKNMEVNKNILKAITIGLAATLAMMPTATVFADEGEGGGEGGGTGTETGSSGEKSEQTSSSEKAESSCDDAEEKAKDYDEHRDEEDSHEEESHEDSGEDSSSGEESYAESIIDEMEAAEADMNYIATESAALDDLYNTANESVKSANEYETAATQGVEYFEGLTGDVQTDDTFAALAADAANISGEALGTATTDKASIEAAANQNFTSEAEAKDAQASAASKILGAELKLADSKAAEEAAEKKLVEAESAYNAANDALTEANRRKVQAEEEVKAAQEAYDKVKDQLGNASADAVENAKNAFLNAQKELEKVNGEQSAANKKALAAVQAKSTAANEVLTAAQSSYDAIGGINTKLISLLADDGEMAANRTAVNEMRDRLINKEAGLTGNDYWVANRELAKSYVAYILIENGLAKPDSEFTIDINKKLTYTDTAGNTKTISIYYEAQNEAGKKVDGSVIWDKNKGEVVVDKINSIVAIAGNFTVDGKRYYTFSEKQTMENKETLTQSKQNELDTRNAVLEAAMKEAEDAKALVDKIGTDAANAENLTVDQVRTNAEGARAVCEAATKAYNDEKASLGFEVSYDEEKEAKLKVLEQEIEGFQKNAKSAGYTMPAYRELAARMAVYSLIQRADVNPNSIKIVKADENDPNSDVQWDNKHGDANHYGTITYETTKGEKVTAYYDYVAYLSKGDETVRNTFDKDADDLKADGYKESYIDVVLKTLDEEATAKKGYNVFVSKGDTCLNETKYNNKTDTYRLYGNMVYAQTLENFAYSIYAVKEAKALESAVQKAQDDVNEAAANLKKARTLETLSTSWIKTLETRLEEAKKVYDEAVTNLTTAQKNTEGLEKVIDEMKAAAGKIAYSPTYNSNSNNNNNNNKKTDNDDASDDTSGASSDEGSPASDAPAADASAVGAPGVAVDAPAGDTTGDAAGVATDGVTTTTTVDGTTGGAMAGEAAGGGALEGDVLGDRTAPEGETVGGELKGDVLGERIAPLVDAVNNGTFDRNMLFDEETKGSIPFGWWLLILVMGAAGVKLYMDHRKKKASAVKNSK
ncbi:MAG: hypothetical protein K5668_00810 [Lachnospiraceae bacterium]|nr:hypothetical protein [Lachnospiraceae bacterium]